MSLENLQNEVLNNTENSEHIRQETNRLLAEANDIIKLVEQMGGDVEAVRKEYEDVRLVTIEAMKQTSEESIAITQNELGSLKKEISKSIIYNEKLKNLLDKYEEEDLNLPIYEIEDGMKNGTITPELVITKLKEAGLNNNQAIELTKTMYGALGVVQTWDKINIDIKQDEVTEQLEVKEERILEVLRELGIEKVTQNYDEFDTENGNYFSSIDEILTGNNLLEIISELESIKQENLNESNISFEEIQIILEKFKEYRYLRNKGLLKEYNETQLKKQIEEIENSKKENKEVINHTSNINTTENHEISSNYTINENIVTTDSGEQITLSEDEIKAVSDNPEALDNLVNFYSILEDSNMLGFWSIRGEIFKAIGEIGFDYEDGNYLDKNEIKLFLNTIMKSIQDDLQGEEIPSTNLSFNDYIEKIKTLNKSSIGFAKVKDTNMHGDSYLMNIFKEKFVDYNSTIINFNTGKFLEAINK